jgi:hypothetical protein
MLKAAGKSCKITEKKCLLLYEKERKRIPRAGKIREPAGAGEDNKSNFCIAKDGELPGFLEQPISSLGESHLPARRVVNPFYHNLSSPHFLFLLAI